MSEQVIHPKTLINHTKHLNLLYVENEKSLREDTYRLLNTFFKKTITANNGKEGLDAYGKEAFDLIISDIRMPIMDGLTMIAKIKELNPSQAVIATSAHDDQNFKNSLEKLKINAIIFKPIDIQLLLETLYKICMQL